MVLTSQGFNQTKNDMNAVANNTSQDGSSLPPLGSNFSTPGKDARVKTHTQQFYEYDARTDEKTSQKSGLTSPKLAKAKSAFNAEAVKKIEEAKEAAFERIMHSANIVKEVLQRNMSLSEDIVKNNQMVENLNNDIYQMQRENEDLRERLEILETITGKDSNVLLNKIRAAGNPTEFEDPDSTGMAPNPMIQTGMSNFNERDLMMLLTDENNSDDFMVKNKQPIINTIYQLGKDKQILAKRIENLEKSKIRKTHMKLRTTNNKFYEPDSDYYNLQAEQRFKATLDQGVDDVEPIRSILNEEDLVIANRNSGPKKFKISKQSSLGHQKRVMPMKRKGNNMSSKSEIRNTNSFNYGAHFRRTRESFLDPDASDRSVAMLPNNMVNKKYTTGYDNNELSTRLNMSGYESGKTSSMNFDNNVVMNPNRLKKSPYQITNYDNTVNNISKPGKYSITAKKYKKRKTNNHM